MLSTPSGAGLKGAVNACQNKTFNDNISSKQVECGIDLRLGERKGVVFDWVCDWYYYWEVLHNGRSYGLPTDPNNFVFKPNLEMTKSGVVRTCEWDLSSCSIAAVKGTLEELFDVIKQLEEQEYGNHIFLGEAYHS